MMIFSGHFSEDEDSDYDSSPDPLSTAHCRLSEDAQTHGLHLSSGFNNFEQRGAMEGWKSDQAPGMH